MEPAMERLRALLAAAVARSGAYEPPRASESDAAQTDPVAAVAATTAAGDGAAAGSLSAATALDTATDGEFTEADRVFWDALVFEGNHSEVRELVEEIGLLLASTNVSNAKLVHLLSVLLVDPGFQSVGVLRIVQRTFHGLKYAKRWEALVLASTVLADAVFAKIYLPETSKVALEFWTEILLGYQHAADLYQRNHSKLADVATFLGEQRASNAGDLDRVQESEDMIKHFVLACAALMHCHRGYEQESYLLQLAMKQTFRDDDLDHPTAVGAEQLLRETAWVLPVDKVAKYLPSIEGKWVVDEFSSDQHASGASAPQNAGSVLLRKTSNCFAHQLSATIYNSDGTQKLRMNGFLFQQIPEMQVLLSQPENALTTPWELEGHWSQVYEANNAAASRPSAPVVSSASAPWSCHACTMSNDASAVKCTTCGTESPARVTIQTSFDNVQGSNPAPFSATFDASYSFMRMRWSRGEQQGVWLARKQSTSRQFDIASGIAAASNSMTDSAYLPMHAYSADGKAENVLVLEKPILSSGSSAEITVQVWIRPQRPLATDSQAAQVVLGYGNEFQLSMSATGELVWEAAGGVYSLISSQLLNFDTFYHVTLQLGKQKMTMAVDGVAVGEVSFSDDARGNLFSSRSPVFSIGGSLTADGGAGAEAVNVFSGAIVDLRIWSSAQAALPATASVSGDEDSLLGYYPLVGHCQRVLLDLSKQENHACVFEAYTQGNKISSGGDRAPAVIKSNFAPTVPLESLPVVLHFSTALGTEFVGSGRFSLIDGVDALLIDRSDMGAALWHSNPVSVASGFQSSFQLGSAQSSATSGASTNTVFALCESSYWKLAPLVAEASTLSGEATSSGESTSDKSALFVSVDAMHISGSGGSRLSIGLFVRSRNHNYKIGQARQIVCETAAPTIQVKYLLPEKVLSVELGDDGAVFECAIDIALALGIQPTSSLHAGLVFPAASSSSSAAAVRVNQWRFEELSSSAIGSTHSVLASVYSEIGSLQPVTQGGESVADKLGNTVICTRCSTDGSAIEQESFGCQTCNLIHGNTVCRICASVCHEGHELVAMGVMSAACACHIRGSHRCRCSSSVNADNFPQLQHPITTSLWCCSKCTVINATELSECSICGNKAPRAVSTPGPSSAPPVSTSRALALVETPKPAADSVDWSCEACTMLNPGDATKCSMCDTVRSKPVEAEARSDGSGLMTLYNAAEDVAKQSHLSVNTSSPWFCSACTMENKSADATCYMCSTPRAVVIADAVESSDTIMDLIPSSVEPILLPAPIDLTHDEVERRVAPSIPSAIASAAVDNLKFLRGYKQTVAEATGQSESVAALRNSSWETTAGNMEILLQGVCVAERVDGTYADKDGYVSGIARFTQDGVWKMEGRYKKLTQTQENALVLQWDSSATRFDGKWFRGDGSGDWKCVLSPSASEFRGLNIVEDSKDSTQLQPYYSGLINMKQNLTNVCYQNSFLQTLFMTQAFRRLILSSELARYVAVPQEGAQTTAGGSDILGCVQSLFARMIASQRPSLDSHGLQRCLPATFQAGRQQDTSDFAHYLIDSLSEQLSQQQDTVDGVSDIFGGLQATVLACKTCGKKSVNKEYFWELLLNMIDLRYTPITSIGAVSGSSMDIATPTGFERMNHDVNKDRTGAPYVFLCVKRCPERQSTSSMDVDDTSLMPITDLVVKVAPFNDVRPTMPGYERVELDLNAGGSTNVVGGKKQVFLFTRREPNGSPITDLQVIYGNESVPDGFKQIRVDLNQGEGTKVFLCYRCDMPITDFKIVNTGIPGYKMVDHLLNLSHEDPVKQYLAYQVGGNEPCLTDLKLVDGSEIAQYENEGWTSIGSPMSATFDPNLPVEHPPAAPSQLMVRRGHGNPIFAVDVFRAPRQVPKYNDYEVIDVYPQANLNDIPSLLKGDWMASDDTDRTRKAVRIHSVSEPVSDTLVVKGSFEDKGEISAITKITSTWSQSVATALVDSSPVYHVAGYWKGPKVRHAQLFDVELRPNADSNLYAISGTIGDGKGRSVTLHGTQTSRSVKVKWPISELFVLRGDEKVPEGVKIVSETCSGRSGNLLAQTPSPHSLYLAVKREETPSSGLYISDVCVIYGEIDVVPDDYTCIQTTPGGHSANINDGTTGVPVFICYRRASGIPNEKVLMDLMPMWTSGPQVDTLPTGFAKIQHTPLGMEANLNQGTTGVAIHLCFAKSDPTQVVKPVENPLNGEYEITSTAPVGFGKFLSLSVMESVPEARAVEGKFGTILHGHMPGSFRGTMFASAQKQKQLVIGQWSAEPQGNPTTMSDFMPASYPFELTLNESGDELDGWWSGIDESATATGTTGTSPVASSGAKHASKKSVVAEAGNCWKLMKDSYVRVAFKKDYGTEWKDGRLIFSERVWRHDIASMLSRFVATRTLGGDNSLSCSQCDRKTESRTHTVIVSPPAHLILTVKRMFYDWTQQKTRKSLHDVEFPALLTLPSLTEEDEEVVFEEGDGSLRDNQRNRHYGLYGVLIHSGMTANSGHYYSFCRESDDSSQQLHVEDSPSSPWIKFNDMKVERSNWKEINRLVANSVSDAVYLLLYKKLSYPVPDSIATAFPDAPDSPSSGGDDEEAMLLAKAMALSMSAAGRKRQSVDENASEEEETKGDDDDNDEKSSKPSHRYIQTSILKEVERENTTFLRDTLGATSSPLHADDLHTLLVLRRALPLHLRAILEQVQA